MRFLLSIAFAHACTTPEPSPGAGPPPPVASAPPSSEAPPNVLLFTLDTTRSDALGCYGNPLPVTPTLDRLAAEGIRFTRAYTVTPLTIPAHSSIFTGLFPPRHGVRDNGDFFLGDGANTLAEAMKGRGYATMASVGAEVTSHHWGFAQGFDAFFDDMGPSDPDEQNRWRVERRGNAVVDDATKWLGEHGSDGPWFGWVHLFDAHHPYKPPAPYDVSFKDQPYLGEVAFADSQVSRVVDLLRERGWMENTLVVAVGDHGEGRGSHGEGMHGVLLYDATTHIPFVVRPPGGASSPGVVDAPVSLVDITPTVLSFVGAPPLPGVDGSDLSPLVADRAATALPADRAVYVESLYAWRHYGWAQQRALVDADHKLIDSTTPELYEKSDAREQHDLSKEKPDLLSAMGKRLGELASKMEPAEGTSGPVAASAERMAQLAALGYVTTDAAPEPTAVGLPDPVQRLPVLKKLERAREALQEGDLEAARAAAEEVVKQEPGLVQQRMMLANILWRQGKADEAMKIVEAVDRERPSSQTKGMMGTLKLVSGHPDEAVDLLEQAVDIDPYVASAWTPLLHALFMSGDLPRLEAALVEAEARVPDLPVVIGMKGLMAGMRGEFDASGELLERALALDPMQPFLSHGLGIVRRAQGRDGEAEVLFSEEVRLHPPSVPSRRALVEIYAAQGRYAEQLDQLDAIAKVEPPSILTLHSRAQALFNLQRFAESDKEVDRCIAMAPTYPHCMMLKANTLKKFGRDAEAQAAYETALALAKQAPPGAPGTGPPGLVPPGPAGMGAGMGAQGMSPMAAPGAPRPARPTAPGGLAVPPGEP